MEKKRILFLAQHFVTLFSFRRELIEILCHDGHEVYLSLPISEDNKFFEDLGCNIIPTEIDRRGVNPIKDIRLISFYKKIITEINPDIIFSYTIKPNVYAAIAINKKKRPNGKKYKQVCNITGTGGTFLKNDLIAKICRFLYRHSIRKSYKVFFQNTGDRDMFVAKRLVDDNWDMLPGSGVNLEHFSYSTLPDGDVINFIFIGRVMKLKGIDEYLEAAKIIKTNHPNTNFYIAGFIEEGEYKTKVESYSDYVKPIGFVRDISTEILKCHCTILPSHGGEGVPNVLLESAAMGRICIGSRIPGTLDVIDDGITGFLFEPSNTSDLICAIEKVLKLNNKEKIAMGLKGRLKVENEFNRDIVIQKYLKEVINA